jgi:hypothetical protein
MIVEVSCDKPISDAVLRSVVSAVEAGLARHQARLTRAEVHLKNLDGAGAVRPVQCTLEARPASRDPVVVSHEAAGLDEVVEGAVEKMDRLLGSLFGRLDSPRGGPSASGLPT